MEKWRFALHLVNCHSRQLSLVCYNSAMATFEKTSRWNLALRLLQVLQQRQLVDALTFNSAAEACRRKSAWRGALRLLLQMADFGLMASCRLQAIQMDAASSAQAWAALGCGMASLASLGSQLPSRPPGVQPGQDPDEGKLHRLSDAACRLDAAGCFPSGLERLLCRTLLQPAVSQARGQAFGSTGQLSLAGLGGRERNALESLAVRPGVIH